MSAMRKMRDTRSFALCRSLCGFRHSISMNTFRIDFAALWLPIYIFVYGWLRPSASAFRDYYNTYTSYTYVFGLYARAV